MDRRLLPRVLQDGTGRAVLVPVTALDSVAAHDLMALDPGRAGVLADASAEGGGLWVVRGEPWARVVTARELIDHRWDHLAERDVLVLFDGDAPRARLAESGEPVDLIVPVEAWERGQTFYFHSRSPLFGDVPVLSKRNHRVKVRRGQLPDEERKQFGRRMVEGQTCGVLSNELGALCVVPDGETALDVRAVHGERVRFIVDGLRDLAAAAAALGEWAERFRAAAAAGWVLVRPIENSFLYAVNRRRLRTLLPLPAPGALVPVGAAVDVPRPPSDESGEAVGPSREPPVPLPGIDELAGPAAAAAAAATAAGGEAPPVDPRIELARDLVEHFARELLDRAPDAATRHGPGTRPGTLPVLRRNVFRRPLGSLLRPGSGGRLLVAVVRVRAGEVDVQRGAVPDDAAAALATTIEDDPTIGGAWGLCRGAFGYVLAEMGSPLRAVESLTSSVSYAHLLDGAETFDDAAGRLAEVAGRLDALAAEGWTLSQPIAGFWLRLRPPAG